MKIQCHYLKNSKPDYHNLNQKQDVEIVLEELLQIDHYCSQLN